MKYTLIKPQKEDKECIEILRVLVKMSDSKARGLLKTMGIHPAKAGAWIKTGFVPKDRWRQIKELSQEIVHR